MSADTKARILEEALKRFSQDGYAGTGLKDIAEAVGLVKSGIYRHFADKEEVWNEVLDEMERYYAEGFGSAKAPPAIPQSTDELKTLTLRMLDFTVHDERIIMTRKLLLTEQFRDERARRLATERFGTGLEAMFTGIFEGMMKNGSLRQEDAAMLAFTYTAPIATLVQLCDREPDRQAEAMEKIGAFIGHFITVYGEPGNGAAAGPVTIRALTEENFSEASLMTFSRYQKVEEVYVPADGQLILKHHPFEEDWSPERRREKAREILSGNYTVFGAFDRDRVVGEIMLVPDLDQGRMIVDSFHVDARYRRRGIGRTLFAAAKEEARRAGAKGLYLSACSARETVDFYRAMGCFVSPAPIQSYAEAEPCDIQMECAL